MLYQVRNRITNTYLKMRRHFLNSPEAATSEEWREFERKAKAEHPVIYRLIEWFHELTYPLYRIDDVKYWILHRTTQRWNMIHTGLKPGYYDTDIRLLHGAFSLLVEYVEVECAGMHRAFHDEGDKVEEKKRSRANGLAYLDWMINLKDPNFDNSYNAHVAKEAKELYLWWVDERPNRTDPWEQGRESYKDSFKIEEVQNDEDTNQLIRLCKIREGLWT